VFTTILYFIFYSFYMVHLKGL